MKHIHVPLDETLHAALLAEARDSGESATSIARQAIAQTLRQRRKAARDKALRAYARQVAGTDHDLDPQWEETGLESLAALEAPAAQRKRR